MTIYRTSVDDNGEVQIEPIMIIPKYSFVPFFSKDRKRPTRWTFLWWEAKFLVRCLLKGNGCELLAWPKRKLKRLRYKRRYTPKRLVFRRVLP